MPRPKIKRRMFLACAAAAAGLELHHVASGATDTSWNAPTSGNWTDPSKWSTSPVYPNNGTPTGTSYDVRIAATGSAYTVSLDAAPQPDGIITVDNLSLDSPDATLSLTGGTLECLTGFNLNAGTFRMALGTKLKNATIGGSGGQISAHTASFDHVTIARDLVIGDDSEVMFDNGLTLDQVTLTLSARNNFRNTQTIGGSGTIAMTRLNTIPELKAIGGVVTIGPGITLEGGGQLRNTSGGYYVNNGTVRANSDTDWMEFRGGFGGPNVNNGLMEATRGALGPRTLVLNDINNTNGIIRAAGGQVIMEQVTSSRVGTLESTDGGAIILKRVMNQGNTLTANPTTGDLQVGEVHGGTLATTGGAAFSGPGGTWYNVTLAGSADVYTTVYGGGIRADTLTLSEGIIRLFGASGAPSAYAYFQGEALTGTGQVVFENSELNVVQGYSAMLTLSQGVTVRTGTGGGSVYFADNYGTILSQTGGRTINLRRFINHGTVRATNSGLITSGATEEGLSTNYGTITADNGGTVTLLGTWSNAADGTLAVAAGGTVNLGGTWNSAGAINVTGGTMNLGGTFPTPTGTFSRTGGVVNITGTLNNTPTSLALNASTGSWNLATGGRILGGTVNTADGTQLIGAGGTIESANILGDVFVPAASSLNIINGSNDGTVEVDGTLLWSGSWTNGGTVAADGGTLNIGGTWSNGGGTITATGGANLTMDGSTSAIGSVSLIDSIANIKGNYATGQLTSITLNNAAISLVPGGVITNTGATLNLSAAFPLQFKGGTVSGGSLRSAPDFAAVVATGAVLGVADVSLDTTITVSDRATLQFTGAWDNNGVVATETGTIHLGGSFTRDEVGVLQRSGGIVRIGGALNNAGRTFSLDDIGTWHLSGGIVTGGTVDGPAGADFRTVFGTTGSLDGVALSVPRFTVASGSTLNVQNGLTLSAAEPAGNTITLLGGGAHVAFAGTQTLAGTGQLVFDGTSSFNNIRPSGAGSTLTLGPGITVRTGTRGGTIGSGGLSTINRGIISARTPGQTVTLLGTITNEGTIEARNGGTVSVQTRNPSGILTNYQSGTLSGGSWHAYAGSTLNLPSGNAVTTNAADIVLSGSGSAFAAIAPIAINEGSFSVLAGRNFYTFGPLTNSGTLTIGQGSTLSINGRLTSSGNLVIDQEGTLYLADHDLLIDYAPDEPSPEADIRQLVIAGLDRRFGITSFPSPERDTVLAIADNTEWGRDDFEGASIDTTTIIGKFSYYGDANLDGKVTGDDYVSIDVNLGTGDSWMEGDFNMDGRVSGDDYVAIDANLGKGSPDPLAFAELKAQMVAVHAEKFGDDYLVKLAAAEADGYGSTVVPEPAATTIIGLGTLLMLRRKRRPFPVGKSPQLRLWVP